MPDPDQPRRTFDPVRLEELAASIPLEGVLQPIVVRYDADRHLCHRAWRAPLARLPRGGLKTIPAIVREVPRIAASSSSSWRTSSVTT